MCGILLFMCDTLLFRYTNNGGIPKLNTSLQAEYKQCHETGVMSNLLSCGNTTICYECFCRLTLGAGDVSQAFYCSEYT